MWKKVLFKNFLLANVCIKISTDGTVVGQRDRKIIDLMDRTLLSDATSSDDVPTPGYMLNEIASKIYYHLCETIIK